MSVRVPIWGRDPTSPRRRLVVVGSFLIDSRDAVFVGAWRWSSYGRYIGRWESSTKRVVLLHRELLGLTPNDGVVVDHINHDGFDNRRINLREVTAAENGLNRRTGYGVSTFQGVTLQGDRWRARVRYRGQSWSRSFGTEEEAAAAALVARAAVMHTFREAA